VRAAPSRWGAPVSLTGQTGQSEDTHSPEAWTRVVVSLISPLSRYTLPTPSPLTGPIGRQNGLDANPQAYPRLLYYTQIKMAAEYQILLEYLCQEYQSTRADQFLACQEDWRDRQRTVAP
jgi:hypothetical protein